MKVGIRQHIKNYESTFMFKQCNVCRQIWPTRQDFIADQGIEIVGYQVNFYNLKTGLLYFHSCKNTIALSADLFADLYDGPIFKEPKTGTDECPQYCLNKDELRRCQAECECAYIREIIQLFRGIEKVRIV
jgi:hypothetical protein